jgi:hypothetical protein
MQKMTKTKRRGGGKSKRVKTLTKGKKIHGGKVTQNDYKFIDRTETVGYKLVEFNNDKYDDTTISIYFVPLRTFVSSSVYLQQPVFDFLKHFVHDEQTLKQHITEKIVNTSDLNRFSVEFSTEGVIGTKDITKIKLLPKDHTIKIYTSVFKDKLDFKKIYKEVLQAAKDDIGARQPDPDSSLWKTLYSK